jgi:hypothetical protein
LTPGQSESDGKTSDRPFIGMNFECCGVYQRIYRNKAGTAYVGWCPKCSRKVEVKIDPRGTTDRFFTAT